MKMYVVRIPLERGVHVVPIEQQAIIRSCQKQGKDIAIHFECNPDADFITRNLMVIFTGDNIPDASWKYLGTVIGDIVYHVYLLL